MPAHLADGLTGWGDCAPLPEFCITEASATAFAEECAHLDLNNNIQDNMPTNTTTKFLTISAAYLGLPADQNCHAE